MRSSRRHKHSEYEHREQSRNTNPNQSIEMRAPKKKKVDDFGFTVLGKEGSSQEYIVNDDQVDRNGSPAERLYAGDEQHIVRTQTVSVSYDNGEGGPVTASGRGLTGRWAPV